MRILNCFCCKIDVFWVIPLPMPAAICIYVMNLENKFDTNVFRVIGTFLFMAIVMLNTKSLFVLGYCEITHYPKFCSWTCPEWKFSCRQNSERIAKISSTGIPISMGNGVWMGWGFLTLCKVLRQICRQRSLSLLTDRFVKMHRKIALWSNDTKINFYHFSGEN